MTPDPTSGPVRLLVMDVDSTLIEQEVIELLAEEPGNYPIRLLDADRDVGTLEISE